MHPLLIQIGSIPIHTYGFLVAMGFLIAVQVFKYLSIRSKLDVEKVLDLAFWGLLVGFLGARLLFVITRYEDFVSQPLSIFKVWEGGLVFFGGPIAVFPYVLYYAKKHKLNLWKVMDVLVPGLTIAHAFGRFGCLAAGCCYGKPTGTNFGVILNSDLVDRAMQGIRLHPTQLYEASALLILFAGLIWIFKNKKFDGQVVLSYFIAYPIIRSIVEIYRGDIIRGFVVGDWLSTSQFISVLIFGVATVALIKRLRDVRK